MAKLTPFQHDVLNDIVDYINDCGEAELHPIRIFPARNNQDNARRRAFKALEKKGVLEHHPDYPPYAVVYRLAIKSHSE